MEVMMMAHTRLAMAHQSSHQNLCFFDMNRDQTRRITAEIDNIIMVIQSAVSTDPRDGSDEVAMSASGSSDEWFR